MSVKASGCVGARAFPGNPYDGHVLAEQLEQTAILLQEVQGTPGVKTVLTDLGYRGVDADIAPVQLVHRGKSQTLSTRQRRWLKRWQAIEPIIGHVKHDHGMRRCWLKGKTGDAVHAVLCAAGYNLRWLRGPLHVWAWRPFMRSSLYPALQSLRNANYAALENPSCCGPSTGAKPRFAGYFEFCMADYCGLPRRKMSATSAPGASTASEVCGRHGGGMRQQVKWIPSRTHGAGGHFEITRGRGQCPMAHQQLDPAHVRAGFQQMHGERVAQRMWCYWLLDPAALAYKLACQTHDPRHLG